MITIDPSTQNIAAAGALKKTDKKNNLNKTKFSPKTTAKSYKTSDAKSSEELNSVSSMLFLQEIDEYSSELENLDVFASKAFKELKELQLAIMSGNISEQHMHNLKNTLDNLNSDFVFPELKELANEIQTRLEVEIAKLEMSKQ